MIIKMYSPSPREYTRIFSVSVLPCSINPYYHSDQTCHFPKQFSDLKPIQQFSDLKPIQLQEYLCFELVFIFQKFLNSENFFSPCNFFFLEFLSLFRARRVAGNGVNFKNIIQSSKTRSANGGQYLQNSSHLLIFFHSSARKLDSGIQETCCSKILITLEMSQYIMEEFNKSPSTSSQRRNS